MDLLPSNPTPSNAPVVILCHGWTAILPRGYQAWIDHLVMRGDIVLWPNYQDNLLTPTSQFVPNAVAAVKSGFQILESGQYGVRPDLDRVAVAGHSAGGMVAAGIAAKATAAGLPEMKALMPVAPGDSRRGGRASVPLGRGSILLLAVPPFTVTALLPIQRRLTESGQTFSPVEAHEMLERWGRLHSVRTCLGLCAFTPFLWQALKAH